MGRCAPPTTHHTHAPSPLSSSSIMSKERISSRRSKVGLVRSFVIHTLDFHSGDPLFRAPRHTTYYRAEPTNSSIMCIIIPEGQTDGCSCHSLLRCRPHFGPLTRRRLRRRVISPFHTQHRSLLVPRSSEGGAWAPRVIIDDHDQDSRMPRPPRGRPCPTAHATTHAAGPPPPKESPFSFVPPKDQSRWLLAVVVH